MAEVTNPLTQPAVWVVDVAGSAGATVDGTHAHPWSLDYAATGADKRIRPGDVVLLRAGVYGPTSGITIHFSGAPGMPVKWLAEPGAVLDGAISVFVDHPDRAWIPTDLKLNHNVYRSTVDYPSVFMYGGFIQVGGQWLPLAPHLDLNWLTSDTHKWRTNGPFYLGPGVTYNKQDKCIYVRLDNSSPDAQPHRDVAQIADPDPRHHALRISAGGQFGLTIAGSYHTFQNLTINNYYGAVQTEGPVTDLEFDGIAGRVTYFGARLGRSSRVSIIAPAFDGCMDPEKWWVAYDDIKGMLEDKTIPADHVRKCGLDYGNAQHVEVAEGYFHDFFDGALSEAAHDVEVHHCDFRTWDDAWQMNGTLYNIDQHHNMYLGAGPSRWGASTNLPNPHPDTLWIHDNIVDTTRYRVFWFRGGSPDDPHGVGWWEAIPLSAHDVPGAGRRTIPWKLYRNTIVTGIKDLPVHSYVGAGQFGTPEATVGGRHEAYNNIFVVTNGRALGQDTWVASEAEIYDGNVYWGWLAESIANPTTIWRFMRRPEGDVNAQFPGQRIGDVARLRSLALIDSQVYYAPGWEAAGLSVDPQLSDYRPPSDSLVASGAVDLTATGWPGTSTYTPWRGAVPP
jgi:hypothetical protein